MPVYTNDSASTAFLEDYGNVEAGSIATVPKYAKNLDAAFSLTTHADAPWVKLHAGVLPVSISSGLAKYGQLLVVNDSGDDVTITANGDATNTLVVLDGATYPISQDREIDAITIAGAGGTNVYVYGLV